jgi:hypothetical protein
MELVVGNVNGDPCQAKSLCRGFTVRASMVASFLGRCYKVAELPFSKMDGESRTLTTESAERERSVYGNRTRLHAGLRACGRAVSPRCSRRPRRDAGLGDDCRRTLREQQRRLLVLRHLPQVGGAQLGNSEPCRTGASTRLDVLRARPRNCPLSIDERLPKEPPIQQSEHTRLALSVT